MRCSERNMNLISGERGNTGANFISGGNAGRRSAILHTLQMMLVPGMLLLVLLFAPGRVLAAESLYTNPDTGYGVYIEDDADLLSDSEETELVEQMKPVTAFGNVGFHSVDSHSGSYSAYAKSYYHSIFGNESGTVFVIDMYDRQLTVFSYGAIYKVVTKSRAETITDNIYRYASNGDYYSCAAEAYSEIETLMEGDEIAKPMKYVSNALLAILLALLLNFLRVRRASRMKAAEIDAIIESAAVDMNYSAPRAVFQRESRTFDPVPRGGGGGGGFHGGGGGGGGFSGGGGGGGGSHGF